MYPDGWATPPCKTKRRYLLTFQVSRYRLLALHCGTQGAPPGSKSIWIACLCMNEVPTFRRCPHAPADNLGAKFRHKSMSATWWWRPSPRCLVFTRAANCYKRCAYLWGTLSGTRGPCPALPSTTAPSEPSGRTPDVPRRPGKHVDPMLF